MNTTDEPRRRWLAILARASRCELETALTPFGNLPALEHVRPPEPGMVMLRGRVGGTGDAFNLGEASVTRCAWEPVPWGSAMHRDAIAAKPS